MNEFIAFFTRHNVSNASIGFMMLAGCFIAIFHTVILSALFRLNFRGWLFFVVDPLLILLAGILNRQLVFPVFFLLFISVFVLGITGMIYAGFIKSKEEKKKREQLRRRYRIAPKPLWKNIGGFIVVALFFVSFYYLGFYSVLLLFIIVPVLSAILPGNRNKFLKYQGTLPTSKIRSVAMGLAEIEGSLECIEPMLSPINNKQCIGYRYRIEDISTNKDGDKSYTTILDETMCNPFYISDETGKIRVHPDKMEFVYVAEDEMYSSGGKRYTQFLIKENDKMLLLGNCGLGENNEPVFEYEEIKKVFAIAPSDKITHYNTFKPLLNSFLIFTCAFALMVSLILVTPMYIKDGQLIIETPDFELNSNAVTGDESTEEVLDVQNEGDVEDGHFQPHLEGQSVIRDSIN
ncbi:hypothetical protein [Niastella populi]|uniref:RING-type E3 ubiquitin transferase n=1 Tax=Niastella populi TaxID=550983 RepID=A0A1V9FJP4_9BACT|nr:hypothetical protein [Niastella populi]OQP58579.1 hypothetical protein A4R26_03755 [Niastella populi]